MKIKKIFKAEVAHRLTSSYSKRCQSYHGHSYTFELELSSSTFNKDAMLLDFGELKKVMFNFMDAFDHSMILNSEDPFTPAMVAIMEQGNMRYMVVPYNPTAEKMAEHIFQVAIHEGLPISAVKVNETLTGQATWTYEDWKRQDDYINLDQVLFSKTIIKEWK